MADGRKEYVVDIGGLSHSMLLDPEDAKRYGDKAVEVKERRPANKGRQPQNKSGK